MLLYLFENFSLLSYKTHLKTVSLKVQESKTNLTLHKPWFIAQF